MPDPETRVMAVDWSGRRTGAEKTIWLAEAAEGQIKRLENGRTRDQVVTHLIELATEAPNIVVGIDFAFGMPEWFAAQEGATNGPEFWEIVRRDGESWLQTCAWPFWGRAGSTKPERIETLRRTEIDVRERRNLIAFSTFQIAGGGQVGTGSIRGMPSLLDLHRAGWSIWPFDPPGFPMVIEIYPRLLMDAVIKSSPAACLQFLKNHFPNLDPLMGMFAASSEDAFDAAVSALVMSDHLDALRALPDLTDDPMDRLEGRIWDPKE
jgi:hypothetical protein